MTSNIGFSNTDTKCIGFTDGDESFKERNRITDIAKKILPNEFIDRIDETVVFERLSKSELRKIARIQLDDLTKRLIEKGIKVTFEDSFIDNILNSERFADRGARTIRQKLLRKAEDLLSNEILRGECKEGAEATVLWENGESKIKITAKNC